MDRIEPSGGALSEGLEAACPYCGETAAVWFEPGVGQLQEFVQDCPVCCRPWHVTVQIGPDGSAYMDVRPEDG